MSAQFIKEFPTGLFKELYSLMMLNGLFRVYWVLDRDVKENLERRMSSF